MPPSHLQQPLGHSLVDAELVHRIHEAVVELRRPHQTQPLGAAARRRVAAGTATSADLTAPAVFLVIVALTAATAIGFEERGHHGIIAVEEAVEHDVEGGGDGGTARL